MGAALCTCGRPDDPGLNSLRYDEYNRIHQARVVAKYGAMAHKYHAYFQYREKHSSVLLSRGDTYTLSDDFVPEEGSEDRLSARQGTAQAYADAFRAKLQEPALSPRSKFHFLVARVDPDRSVPPTEASGEYSVSPTDELGTRKRPEDGAGLDAWPAAVFPELVADDDDDDESVTEDEWKARANPVKTIIVPPGPCGLVLQLDREDAPVVDGFVRQPDGTKSTIENSGLITKGDVLCAINDIDVTRLPLKDVLRTLTLSSHLERAFTFRTTFKPREFM